MARRRLATGTLTIGVLLRAASACVGNDPDPLVISTPDAAGTPGGDGGASAHDDASPQDGSSSRCSASEPFGALESLGPVINTPNHETSGRFSSDLLSFVFARQEVGAGHIEPQLLIARRSSADAPFEVAVPVFETPTGQHDVEPSFTPWGAIVFHRGERGDTRLMMAAPNGSGFAPPEPLGAAINVAGTERSPFVAVDGTLYFSRAPSGSGPITNDYELFMSAANADKSFAAPVPVPGLTRPGQSETLPVVNGTSTVIYFSSLFEYDAGGLPATDTTIYRAERASRDVVFGLPQAVLGLNTSRYDTTSWASEDDCTIVVAHRSADASDTIDLFVARRQRR